MIPRILVLALLPTLVSCIEVRWEWMAFKLCRRGLARLERCQERFDRERLTSVELKLLRREIMEARSELTEGAALYEVLSEASGLAHETALYWNAKNAVRDADEWDQRLKVLDSESKAAP